MSGAKKILKKTGKILLWILFVVLILVAGALIFINTNAGKRFVKNQAQKYLRDKLKTKVEIGSVDYSLPKWVELKSVYFGDRKNDTLFYGGELRVDLDMIALLRGNTDIHKVEFKNIFANISRSPNDSVFNYEFIINAFTGNKSTTPNTDTAEMKLSLKQLIFDNVALKFRDSFAGNNFMAAIKSLDVTTTDFHPDRVKFGINNFYARGVTFLMDTYKETPVAAQNIPADSIAKSPYQLFLTANNISLRDVDVLVDNEISGLHYQNKITQLGGTKILFSPGSSKGTAENLALDSSVIVFSAPKTAGDTAKNKAARVPSPWLFSVTHLAINNTDIKYDDNNIASAGGLDFSHLDTKNLTASVAGLRYSTDTTTAVVSDLAFADKSGFELDSTHLNLVFTNKALSVTDIYVKTPHSLIQKSFQLTYDSLAAIMTAPQNTEIAAMLSNTVIAFNDLYMLVPAMEKSLPKAQFANQYLNLNTELRGNLQRLYIPYLQLSGLSGSKLSARGTIYNMTDPIKFSYDLFIDQSNIFKKDLLKFVPPENQAQLANLPDIINLKGRLTGDKNDVAADINASANGLSFVGKLGLKNISDPLHLQYAVAVTSATVNKKVIQGFLPPAVSQQLALPDQISLSGKLSGDVNDLLTDAKIGSSYGPLTVKGFIKNIKDPQRATYDLLLSTPGFAVGRLLRQDSVLGRIAGSFTAKGTGFDYKTMRSAIKADIASLQYNKYDYHNAHINAGLENGLINSTGSINDENLKLRYAISSNVKGEYPTVKGTIDVDTAQLNKLHLTPDTLNVSLKAVVDAQNLKPRQLNASLLLNSIHLQNGKNFYGIDSTSLIASSANGIDSIVLKAPFADVHAGGAFDYDQIGESLQRYVNDYYKIPGFKPSAVTIAPQQIAIKGTIRQTRLLTGFVPGLGTYSDINFSGRYSSADTDSALSFNATVPQLTYTTTHIGNGAVNIGSKNGRINYELKFDTLKLPGNILYASNVSGAAAKDSISLNALTKDAAGRSWFGLAGSAFVNDDTYSFRMQDTLLLNYERWNVAPDNYISYSPRGIIVNNFRISSDTASISLKSRELVANSPIDIDINNFNLKSISSIVNHDTVFLAGVMDVKASVSDLDKPLPGFTGNARITNLQYLQHPLGDVTFNAQKKDDNTVSADLSLLGAGNDFTAKGDYYLNGTDEQFDANLDLRKLNMRTLEALSAGQLQNSSGNITGNLKLNGKFSDPRWNGQISFDTVKFSLAQLGTPYLINGQKINLNYPTVSFPDFTVMDSLRHPLKVSGTITSRSMMDYDLGLKITAKDFAIVNAKRAVNSQVYGFAAINANVDVTGTAAMPNIDGNISMIDKSDVHIILPEASYAKNDGASIVRFVDADTFNMNPPVAGFEPAKAPAAAFAQFLNYNLNIEVGKKAALTILLDPTTGDEIRVQGDAQINAGVDPGGNLVLAGTYVLDSGYYDLHYQILERKFNLVRGSTITFAGEPLNATANITAVYIANTSAKNLLSNEVTDVSATLANSFNQSLPFRVVLYLTGPLNKPNINFDVQLPESNNLLNNDLRTTIENKLQQIRSDPAAINKQVFSLLLLGHFVNEQSSDFFKGNGGDFSDLARQSVSQFLSSALNEIAGDLFKGIDIDLNLNSYNDFSNGGNTERTDLNIAVSKSFANDRLTVSVGQNFGLEGQDATAKAAGANTGFKPDVTVSYKLTADGKYLLRAYTRNQFEVEVDGYVVENGVAFVLTMDYNKFRELFQNKKKQMREAKKKETP